MAGQYLKLSRHGTIYYFRRRVPDDLRIVVGKPHLVRSLGTPDRREATRAGALLRWAKKKRTWGVTDDFQELFRYPGEIPKNPYLKFDQADLVALFEADSYKHNKFKTPSEYWLPVLGLFTGARLNELCQLTTADVGHHDGVETISILDEDLKRLKTEASRRIVG